MLAQTRLKRRWAEEGRDDTAASVPPVVSAALFPPYPDISAWIQDEPPQRIPVDESHARGPQREFSAVVHGHVRRRLDTWSSGTSRDPTRPSASRSMSAVLVSQVGNIVWSARDLEESLMHALESARRQHFEALVATWKTETVFVSSVTKKWSHPAYRSIVAMGKPAIPLILEQIGDGGRLWTQALLSITAENPAEATRSPEEAQQAWLKWGEESGWLDP